jgi:signal transduction histidine kinase
MVLLFKTAFRNESIKELKYIKWCMIMVNFGITGLYFCMFYSLPNSFLWISRVARYEIYNSMKIGSYFSMMKIIPYLIIFFILILCYNVVKYEKTVKRIENEEYMFSNIVASTEISTRAFSHYIKNELLGIISEVEYIMKNSGEEKGRRIEGLDTIRSSCMEMYSRLDELQKNSNRIVLNQTLCDFCKIIDRAIDNERAEFEKKSIRLNYKRCEQRAVIFGDSRYLAQVFKNIFRNAIEAMEENQQQPKEITIEIRLFDSRIEVVVTDSGPGLDSRIQQRLFEPFVSTKSTKSNWGIGLSFCKRIISRHRGKIEAFNLPGHGAGFRIELPLVQQEKG